MSAYNEVKGYRVGTESEVVFNRPVMAAKLPEFSIKDGPGSILMPVKVRCSNCSKVLNAPDRARGKAIRCPGCQNPVRVPTGTKKKVTSRKSAGDENFLAGLDVGQVEHTSERVCPKCAADVSADDIECPECGINLATGAMSSAQRKIRDRIGPDPKLFYTKVWSNSWEFLKKNRGLAIRTAIYWTIFTFDFLIFSRWAFQCNTMPPFVFWMGLASLSLIAIPGWYWYLTTKVIQATLEKKTKIKEIHFDYEKCSALGIKSFIWAPVLLMPIFLVLLPVIVIMILFNAMAFGESGAFYGGVVGMAILGGIYTLPMLAFPIAMSHMSMRYTYKAWLPVDMIVLFFKNIGPALYWWLIVLVVTSPFLILGFAADYFLPQVIDAATTLFGWLGDASLWCAGLLSSNVEPGSFLDGLFWYPFAAVTLFILVCCITIPAAFPAIYLMRANALFTYFNYQSLDLVTHSTEGETAGFWVRYLAWLIDMLVISIMIGFFYLIYALFAYLAFRFGLGALALMLSVVVGAASTFAHYRYYVRSEIGTAQGTLGKSALGLKVVDMQGEKITLKTARNRYLARYLTNLIPFYLGYLMVLFTPEKQTLHDALTKTKVIWIGDDD